MNTQRFSLIILVASAAAIVSTDFARAEAPGISYIFPAGGQRGQKVDVRVGGFYLFEGCPFYMSGDGVTAPKQIARTKRIWFEGPVIPMPASQAKENYPRDYSGQIAIAKDAGIGFRRWQVSTSQGVTATKQFIVGDLPEIIEQEIDGAPVPTQIKLPVTINGRIFPREDIDIWTFDAKAGQEITCEVLSARIGSPLDSRLEVRGPKGQRIAENVDGLGTDSFLRFKTPSDGKYAVHIHDINFKGLQHYVYRLTITNESYLDSVYPLGGRRGATIECQLEGSGLAANTAVVALPSDAANSFRYYTGKGFKSTNSFQLEVSDLPERLEREPNNKAESAINFITPSVLNGRIDEPGDVDCWTFVAKKGEDLTFDVHASQLNSPLDSLVTLYDAAGKQIGQADDASGGQTDSRFTKKIPADGRYSIQIEDRLPSRGGRRFAYRLYVTKKQDTKNFELSFPAEVVNVPRGGEFKYKLNVDRSGGYADEIELTAEGLPNGVTADPVKVGKNQKNAQLTFKVAKDAKVSVVPIKLKGVGKQDDSEIVRYATFQLSRQEAPRTHAMLAVAVPTPFKFVSPFATKYSPRGSVFTHHYQIERGGFEGPLEVDMADTQARHLQGVTGSRVSIAPDQNEFDYSIALPSWMEIGRTSRTCVMIYGTVEDADGTKHKVCYSSQAQDDQMIILVDPTRLSLKTERQTLPVSMGKSVKVAFQVKRGVNLTGPVKIELVTPDHIRGVTATPAMVAADANDGELSITFDKKSAGPFNMPVILRATIMDERNLPVTSESRLTIVDSNAT